MKLFQLKNSRDLFIPNAVYSDQYKVFAATNYGFSRVSIIDSENNVLIRKEIFPKYATVSQLFFVDQWLFVMWFLNKDRHIYAINVVNDVLVKTSSDDSYRFFGRFGSMALFIGRNKQGQSFNCLFCLESGSFTISHTDFMNLHPTFRDEAGAIDCYGVDNAGHRSMTIYQYQISEQIPLYQNIIDNGREIFTIPYGDYVRYGKKHYTIKRGAEIHPKLYSYSGLEYEIKMPNYYSNVELTSRKHAIIDSDNGHHYLIFYAHKDFGTKIHVFYWCYRIQNDSCELMWEYRLPCDRSELSSSILTGSQLFHGSTFLDYPMPEDKHLAGKLNVLTYDTGELKSIDHQGCVIAGVREIKEYYSSNFFVPNYKSNVYLMSNLSSVSMYKLTE